MPVPADITDALESILDIYFSGVRHRERAAFILCDNLVEMACKVRAREYNHAFNMRCNFHDAINAPGLSLTRRVKSEIQGYRDTRNNMQHANAAATVDMAYCANAILAATTVIDKCWPGTLQNQLQARLQCALRVVRLYSSSGDINKRSEFEQRLLKGKWKPGGRKNIRVSEIPLTAGQRDNWMLLIRARTAQIEAILNELEVD